MSTVAAFVRPSFRSCSPRALPGRNEGRVPWEHRRDDLRRAGAGRWCRRAGLAERHRRSAAETTTVLPEINVTDTRLVGGPRRGRRGVAPGTGTERRSRGARRRRRRVRHRDRHDHHRRIDDRHHRAGHRALARADLQDILAREPGIQVRNLFGGVNGARSTVDMRGFGATATSNTLVLINGRRLNDIDHGGRRSQRHPARTASSGSRSPAAIPARCSTATARSAASSTSSPRPASTCRRRRACRRASARSTTRGQRLGQRLVTGPLAVRDLRARQRHPLRRLSREQQAAPEECGRRFALDQRQGPAPISISPPTTSIWPAGRPARDADRAASW